MSSIIMDIMSFELTAEETALLKHPNVAGVILFERNVNGFNRQQLCQLTQHIHTLRPEIIIMTDHEGGFIQRFKRMGFQPLMSAGSHGRNYDINPDFALKIAYQEGKKMASDLISCGIDLSLAPVLDLHHPACSILGGLDRAFHENPDIIIQLARAYIKGMHDAGMPSVGKHFPGHGSCTGDSHITLPVNHKTLDQLENTDLKPFTALIKEKLLDAIMPAHVLYPEIDPHHAATYSSRWLQEILRDTLQFDGLVISDCLGMKGADIGNLIERAHRAHQGCDLLIAANQQRSTLRQLLDALLQIETTTSHLEIFKQKMKRFNNNNSEDKNLNFLSESSVNHVPDSANPTHTI